MPLGTDFNVSPYYDDYDRLKGYRKILFKPGVAVQVRELNQLQTMLQDQIEQFGDNILKRGTIIEGCGLSYFSVFPYVKLKDNEVDGAPVNVSSYRGMYAKNSDNLEALIVTTIDGFESQTPDLNTLYVKYINSGNDGNTTQFSANQTLTIYDKSYPIFSYDIVDGSSGFSNNDTVVVVPSLAIQNSTGGSTFPAGAFLAGHVIQNNVANLEIVEANTTANSQALILRVKPLAVDLKTANSILWTFNAGETIRNATTANTANVVALVGTSAEATLITDSLGKATSIQTTNLGRGYYVPPFVTISITSNSSITTGQINQLDVDALNYKATVTVADSSHSPIGTGYGAKVSQGTVYQKGYFSRVEEQTIVVEKYSNTDFDAVVGFNTEEVIVTSNQDETLLDNATGSPNETAPGADRLQLNPTLVVITPTEAQGNTDFLPIIEFTDGVPFRQRTQTVYSVIGDEMAQRTYEESGNYVINQFLVQPKDDSTLANTATTFQIIVDPGVAYIRGHRVATTGNYTKNINKGSNTINLPTATSRVAYGSYIKIKNLGGIFRFNYGDTVTLYDTAASYVSGISNGSNAITAPSGNILGYARMRSLLPGDNNDEYHLYLFDIKMNTGKNLANVRSVYYNNTLVGVADTVLNSANNTVVYDVGAGINGLLVKNQKASKSANGITYTYRTFDTSKTANSTGYITITPGAGQSFPYSGTLVNSQEKEFMIVPKGNYQAQVNAAGTVTFSNTTANVTGSGTSFLTAYRAGDFIKVANNAANAVAKILNVANDTFMTLTANAPISIANTSYLYYPNNIPLIMTRDNRSIVVESNGSITAFIGNTVANTSGSATTMDVAVAYNIKETGINPDAKTIKRGLFSRFRLANCGSNSTVDVYGPWAIGTSDVFRMTKVLKANGASVALTFNSQTAVSNTNDTITVSHQFANGDSVLYNNTSGASITGLTNNTTYYVVSANSSTFKLASSRNGSAIDLTAVSGGGDHTLTGLRLYFANGTPGAVDVTNEFYIDHKQNEDFLDISYLVRKPNLTTLSNNDVLLVEYDAFTSTTGVKTISSYNITDGQNTSSMGNSSISTFEIPEVWGINGEYYDLRDQFDFRPSAANTIPLVSEASNTSILNPTVPAYVSRFTAAEKKFPLNDSDLIANVSYYLGRTDRVVVDVFGNINVIAGVDGRTEPPPPPNDTITLQLLEIPAYPSLPKTLNQENIKLVDTRVYNGKGSKRVFDYTVAAPIDENQRELLQVKNYTMNDIASLENRISSLEYYVSYTLAEAIAKSRFIPSSLDSSVDRWKVGFFVDPFTNYNFSEVLDPEYFAIIEDDKLTSNMDETVIEFKHETSPNSGQSLASIPYEEITVFKQLDATATLTTDSNTVTSNTVAVTTQQIASEIKNNKNNSWSMTSQVYEDWDFTMSETAGPVEIYMNNRGRQNAISVLQAESPDGPWVEKTNSNSASGVSQADVNSKGISTLLDNVGFYKPGTTFRQSVLVPSTSIYWMRDHQKILFTHDPTGGIYYRIRVYKGSITVDNAVYGKYAFKIFYPSDSVSYRTTFNTVNPDQYVYSGEIIDITPRDIVIGGSNISDPNNQQIWTSRGVGQSVNTRQLQNNLNPSYWWTPGYMHTINVVGLKPNTYHNFIFDGVDATTKCKQIRTTTTNTTGLLSDENGSLKFEFYNDFFVDWSSVTTNFAEEQLKSGLTPGAKSFSLENADISSFANGVLNVAAWIAVPQIETGFSDMFSKILTI